MEIEEGAVSGQPLAVSEDKTERVSGRAGELVSTGRRRRRVRRPGSAFSQRLAEVTEEYLEELDQAAFERGKLEGIRERDTEGYDRVYEAGRAAEQARHDETCGGARDLAALLNNPVPINKKDLYIRLREILALGWQEMPKGVARYNGTGGPGNYLEDLIGLKAGNQDIADVLGWEVKYYTPKTNYITLFHKEAEPAGVMRYMVNRFGWKDAQGRMSFRHTILPARGSNTVAWSP